MAMQVGTETKAYDTINVTPMLDLAYVLLVIFIIMTTASVQGLTMNLPKPSSKPSTERHEVRIVQVTPDGSLMLNGVGVSMPELERQLETAHARDRGLSVMIKGDPRTQYARVISVVDLANRLGIGNVGLITARIGT
jgi:biopolymer transport protein ExbD